MKNLSIREVRKELAQLDDLVAREGEVVVTRRGKPIARLLPMRSKRRMPSHADLRASMPRLKKGSEKHLRAERDER
ncbi:MAG: type II toxin-antitoxin system prevent-host-death family antitoxin [Chromatiales bacterium]|jgi:prevent-host-death family protein|nr:type II toxin-antitoxin system prevent-host-death family antitoxin [Chromatiales bacterium]